MQSDNGGGTDTVKTTEPEEVERAMMLDGTTPLSSTTIASTPRIGNAKISGTSPSGLATVPEASSPNRASRGLIDDSSNNSGGGSLRSSLQQRFSFPFYGGGQSSNSSGSREVVVLPQQQAQEEIEPTDEEKFEQWWPTIRMSNYHRLVLPPECKLVEYKHTSKEQQQLLKEVLQQRADHHTKQQSQKHQQQDVADMDVSISHEDGGGGIEEEEPPEHRLWRYWQQLKSLIISIYSYDYDGAAKTLVLWLQTFMKIRRHRAAKLNGSGSSGQLQQQQGQQNNKDDKDENDENDDATSSVHTSVSSSQHQPLQSESLLEPLQQDGDGGDSDEKSRTLGAQGVSENQNILSSPVIGRKGDQPSITTGIPQSPPFKTPLAEIRTTNTYSETGETKTNLPLPPSLLTEEKKSDVGLEDVDLGISSRTVRSSSIGSMYESVTEFHPSPLPTPTMTDVDDHNAAAAENEKSKRQDSLEDYRNSIPSLKHSSTPASMLAPRLVLPRNNSSSTGNQAPQADDEEKFTSSPVPYKIDTASTDKASIENPLAAATTENNSKDDDDDNNDDKMGFFEAAHSTDALKKLKREFGGIPDKNGYIVGDEFLNSKDTPLLVFVNARSGPQQGHVLMTQLRRLLNPIQVWDLANGGPEKVLESFSAMSKFRILVCGGDGTVSWIIGALEKMAFERWPPIAILPLGTGNDLARIHGWGGGYNNESLIMILEQIAQSYVSLLDRWEMTTVVKNKKNKEKVQTVKSFTNYLGVGADAHAALQFHLLRKSKPNLFFSRVTNKAWYAVFGTEEAIKASCAEIQEDITLIADGVEVPIPPDSQGIILLNIDSYTGGVPLWSHGVKSGLNNTDAPRPYSYYYSQQYSGSNADMPRRSQSLDSLHLHPSGVGGGAVGGLRSRCNTFERVDSADDLTQLENLQDGDKLARITACDKPSSCQDGLLDIVSIRGTMHLGQIRVGLSNAELLCQCREATIHIKKKISVQIDGEPWRQSTCTLQIRRKKDPAIMLHRSPDESGGVETEMAKLLDWAEEKHHIDRSTHALLMKEFSRRIENKTRQRRVQSQDNLMFSLKRAIANTSAATNAAAAVATGGTTSNPYNIYHNTLTSSSSYQPTPHYGGGNAAAAATHKNKNYSTSSGGSSSSTNAFDKSNSSESFSNRMVF